MDIKTVINKTPLSSFGKFFFALKGYRLFKNYIEVDKWEAYDMVRGDDRHIKILAGVTDITALKDNSHDDFSKEYENNYLYGRS